MRRLFMSIDTRVLDTRELVIFLSVSLYSPPRTDKNVYEEVERGQFRIAIRHLAQVTALGCVDNAIISAGLDGHVRFITGFTFESQLPVIRCMAVNDDNIALGGPDGAISVHDHNGRLQRHWEGHSEGTVYSVLWWNEILLTSSADSDLKAWNFAKGKSKSLARKGNLHEDRVAGPSACVFASYKSRNTIFAGV